MRRTLGRIGGAAMLALLIGGLVNALAPVLREPTAHDARARALAHTIMSPYCPGRTLDTCPSPQATVLRRSIADRLAAGDSTDRIVNDLAAVFGEEIRGVPQAKGVGLLLWIGPLAIAALLGVAIVRIARQPALVDAQAIEADARAHSALGRRLTEELEDLD